MPHHFKATHPLFAPMVLVAFSLGHLKSCAPWESLTLYRQVAVFSVIVHFQFFFFFKCKNDILIH
jgi:hypothetical protein